MKQTYLLPANILAERFVIGSLLHHECDNRIRLSVFDILGTDQEKEIFYNFKHQQIYNAILHTYYSDAVIDLVSVTQSLVELKTYDDQGINYPNVAMLDELLDSIPTPVNAGYYAELVKETYLKRRLILDIQKTLEFAYSPDSEMPDILAKINDAVNIQLLGKTPVYSVRDSDTLYQKYVREIGSKRIKFGFPEIDRVTRGMVLGDVVVILARSGVGKSALVQSIQLDIWRRQHIKSIFFSLEMTVTSLYERLASMVMNVGLEEIEGRYIKGETNTIQEGVKELEGIFMVDQAGMSLDQIENTIKARPDISVAFIDYLGLIKGDGKDRYERASNVAQELKEIAKRNNVVIVVVAQTNRTGGDGTEPIDMNDARDSGVIEEGADTILCMHKDKQNVKYRHIYARKARNGKTGGDSILMFYNDTPRLVPLLVKNFA